MIVEAVRTAEREGALERRARVRWSAGELELWIAGPPDLLDDATDGSAFLCATLPLAMRLGERLEVESPVSPLLLESCETIQRVYGAWDPGLRAIEIAAQPIADPPPPATRAGAFFSRGVDSTFAAARDRAGSRSLSDLVFVDRFEPLHDGAVRAEEIRRARLAAERLGLPLAVVETNLRELSDPIVSCWEDYLAAAMGFVAHALAGVLGRMVAPSGDCYLTIEPSGANPLLDPLFSGDRVAIEHDALTHSRIEKIGWLARERRDLLGGLKVCFKENRPDNCGVCGKCLLTMTGLRIAGALDLATEFPDRIDLEAIGRLRLWGFRSRADWVDACRRLDGDPGDEELRAAVLDRLREVPVREPVDERGGRRTWLEPRSFRDHRLNAMLALTVDGRAPAPIDGYEPRGSPLGLVRAVDRDRDRHVYAVGRLPEGELAGELGALHQLPGRGSVPAWLTWDGQLAVEGIGELPASGLARRARWTLAPLGWRDLPDRAARLRGIGWRLPRALRPPIRPQPAVGEPAGYLHRDPGPGRLPLYSARHPVLGDQLLTTRPQEPNELGYVGTTLFGHLDAAAPVTGHLGPGRPQLPWGSRFGRRVSEG